MENNTQTQKDIFDLSEEEFDTYFESNIRNKMNGLMRSMWKLNENFLANNMFFIIFIFIPIGIVIAILVNSDIGPTIEAYEKIHPEDYEIIISCVFIIWGIISIFLFKLLAKIVFDKPAKKIIFKELGFEYYNGLFYFSDFEHVAKHLSKSFFRVDEMLRGKYKNQKLDIIDCAEKGSSHKIFIATKIERKFSAQTLIETKGSSDTPFFEGSQVNLEDINFSKVYNVFSEDQVEARYILTPTFMERLLKYNIEKGGVVQVFFSDKVSSDYNAFFYIPVKNNWFEMPLTKKISFAKEVRPNWFYGFLQDITEIMQVVEALKLDQDIGL